MVKCVSFKSFVYRAIGMGDLLEYDDSSWITQEGLGALDIKRKDLRGFALDAIEHCMDDGTPYFTVPWLRREVSDLPLLDYGLSNEFYESVLMSQEDLLAHGNLAGVKLFAPQGSDMKGREFIRKLVAREESIDLDDLVDDLKDDYGIVISRSRLSSLVRDGGLFYSSEFDRVYVDHDRFVLEVE